MKKQLRAWAIQYPLWLFYGLAFGGAWMVWGAVGLLAPRALGLAALPGAWMPTVAALIVTGLAEGRPGVRALVGRLLRWRVGLAWYAAMVLGPVGITAAARGLYATLGGAAPPVTLPPGVPSEAWPAVVPVIFAINLVVGGPLAEELGWRGFALEKLRAHTNTLTAALMVGAGWAVWHLPLFWLAEGSAVVGGLPFVWFGLLTIAWSVLMAWAYVSTGSVLLPVLLHAAVNTLGGTLGLWGRGGSGWGLLLLNVGLTWLTVAAIVAVFGRDLIRRRLPGRLEAEAAATSTPAA